MADIARDGDDTVDTVVLDDGPVAEAAAGGEVVELGEAAGEALPVNAVLREDGTVELTLRQPVTLRFKKGGDVREEAFASLVFHPLTGADMRVISTKPADSMTATSIARSTRIHEGKMAAVYDRLDARDATAAQRCVLYFLDDGRPTGR